MKIRIISLLLLASIFSLFHFSTIVAEEDATEISKEDNNNLNGEQNIVEDEGKDIDTETTNNAEDTTVEREESNNSKPEDTSEASNESDTKQENKKETNQSTEKQGETTELKNNTEAFSTASSTSFQQGDTHKEIAEMKTKLNAIGFGGIKVTNYFGSYTEQRVKQFQENYDLQSNGIADQATLAKINDVYTSPFQLGNRHQDIISLKQKMNKTPFGGILVTDYYGSYTVKRVKEIQRYYGLKDNGIADSLTRQKIDALVSTGFQPGDRNEEIINIKNKLNSIGFGQITVTDYFGSFTQKKVKEFQNYYGLEDTGTANTETLKKIDEVYYSPFQEGKKHSETVELKEKLNKLGFGNILVTTYYGSFTAKQVKSFQQYYGLKVNGIADEVTRSKMDDVLSSPFQKGKRHEEIINMKKKLNLLGYGPITVSTFFGSYTEKQVKEFQSNYELRKSGIMDEISMKKLNQVMETAFQQGARHDGIIDLKNKLNRLGFGNIQVTNYFGSFTEKKVKEFQGYYGLKVTGIANSATLNKIDEMMNHPLRKGRSHKNLPELKQKLNWLGYGEILVTDYFGSFTEKKLKEFQNDYDLPVSGIGEDITLNEINEAIPKVFREGSRHSKISQLKSYLDRVGFGGILITDYYGSYTSKRVKEFQSYYGLKSTGIANYETLNKLDSLVDSPFQEGKRHEKTKQLKKNLNKLGFNGLNDSNLFDSLTKQHVTSFQEYYGLVVNGIADEPTFNKINEILSSPFQEGIRHQDTIKLKEDLNRIGFGNILVTTLYGNYTAKRVSDFQAFYGLRVNGIAEEQTLNKIDEIITSPMQKGNTHPDISKLKQDLNSLGYDGIQITNYFGDFTEKRLKQFQEDYGLPISGIADEVTLMKLKEALESREVFTYSKFDISLEEALDVQMNQLQQTDKYRNEPAYIHSNYVEIVESAIINGNGVRLRTSPKFNDNIATTVNRGTKVTIRKTVTGASYSGSTRWYEIGYDNKVLYVHASLVDLNGSIAITTDKVNIRSEASNSSHIYDTVPAGTSVNILEKGNTWHKISYNTWRNPTRTDVLNYLDPNNNDVFQHLQLSKSAGVSAAELNKVLVGKGILEGKGQAFIDGGKQHAVNEIYLISHALLETGHGDSDLATGIKVGKNSTGDLVLVTTSNKDNLTNIRTTYNMFGIGAVDGDAHRQGAFRAYREGWFSPEAAIIGGAKFIGEKYIHNAYNQDTLYKMRWNPANPGYPQYATDIGWAVKQVEQIKKMYSLLDNPLLHFNIIQYK